MAREVEKSAEELRQEGREEVLDWLVKKEIINYSIREDQYFIWNFYKTIVTTLPWTKNSK